jgi:hypothetical protein
MPIINPKFTLESLTNDLIEAKRQGGDYKDIAIKLLCLSLYNRNSYENTEEFGDITPNQMKDIMGIGYNNIHSNVSEVFSKIENIFKLNAKTLSQENTDIPEKE